ncbi:MAG: hypothetical protein QOJ29_5345 [Thermoleophilaceae bacterium]|jgi:hypothetical protein|nr:hypothetical protein [Thermoleophilaceae bacterium]
MLRTRGSLAVVVFALLGALLAACGSGGSGNVKDTLDKGFSTPIKSARIDLEITIKLDGIKQLNGPIKLSVQGPYESGGSKTIPKADWDIAASAAGQNFSAGFISTGDNAWVGFQGQNYEVGKSAVAQINTQIAKAAGSNKKKGLSQFGVDARNWLTDAKDQGTEKVAGVDTNHVSAALDVGKFLDDLNKIIQKAGGSTGTSTPSLTASQKKQIQDVVKNPRFDVYVGKSDNVIRRLSADISFQVPSDKQAQVGGLKSGTVSFSIEFADVGKPQTISAPANAKPISELTSQLGGLGSLLGGGSSGSSGASGSSGSSGSSSGSSGPSADALQKYSQCLQKADPSKPAELQKCADLLK